MRRLRSSHARPRRDRALLLTVAAAILVRVLYALAYFRSPLAGDYRADQGYYREWASRIAGGDLWGQGVFEQGPLYAYLLALGFRIFGPRDEIVLALQLLAGVGTCALVVACGRRLLGARAAAFAGIASAVFGPLIFYECMVMKTFLSPLLTMAALYGALRYAEDARLRWLAASAASVGLACLVRENHVLLLIPVALQGVAVGRAHGFAWRSWGVHALVLAAAFGLVILPVTLRNHAVAGEWVAVTSGGGEVLYIAHGPDANGYFQTPPFVGPSGPSQQHEAFREEASRRLGRELTRAESSRYWSREALREALRDPARAARLALVKLSGLLNDFEAPSDQFYAVTRDVIPWLRVLPSFGWVCGLGVLGIALSMRSFRRFQLPLLFLAAHGLSLLLTFNFGSFRAGMLPVWMLFVGLGLDWLVAAWPWKKTGIARPTWAFPVGALVVVTSTAIAFLRPLNYESMPFEYERSVLEMALAMKVGDVEGTEHHLRRALEHAPAWRKAEAHRALGQLLEETGRREQALRHYRAALEIESGGAR